MMTGGTPIFGNLHVATESWRALDLILIVSDFVPSHSLSSWKISRPGAIPGPLVNPDAQSELLLLTNKPKKQFQDGSMYRCNYMYIYIYVYIYIHIVYKYIYIYYIIYSDICVCQHPVITLDEH